SGMLAGASGVLIGIAFNSVHFLMGEPYMLRAFVVMILGGLGSLSGAVVAGLLLGILQNLTSVYLPTGLSDIIIFSLLFITLVFKPQGLFGDKVEGIGLRVK
ncbi:MAG: branched-chain amino acid ABC transporter permease, partial [Actinomycetes bacterium]